MFEVKCIVGDKKLSEVMRALGGLTLEPPVVIAVDGAEILQTKKPRPNGDMTSFGLVTDLIKRDKLKKITAAQLKQYLVTNGYSSNGYSYALKLLLERKIVKKTKEPSVYEVL